MESIVEDAEVKAACYRDVEAVIGSDSPAVELDIQFSDDAARRRHARIPNGPSWSIRCRRS